MSSKKYTHHIVFITEITAEKVMHGSFDSDELVPYTHEMQEYTQEFMRKFYKSSLVGHPEYRIAIKNLSTFKN